MSLIQNRIPFLGPIPGTTASGAGSVRSPLYKRSTSPFARSAKAPSSPWSFSAGEGLMVATKAIGTNVALRISGATKLTAPDDQRVVEQPTLLEVLDEGAAGLIGVAGLGLDTIGKRGQGTISDLESSRFEPSLIASSRSRSVDHFHQPTTAGSTSGVPIHFRKVAGPEHQHKTLGFVRLQRVGTVSRP